MNPVIFWDLIFLILLIFEFSYIIFQIVVKKLHTIIIIKYVILRILQICYLRFLNCPIVDNHYQFFWKEFSACLLISLLIKI